MTMKRRSFLGMFGAVVAAPAIPMAAPAGYSSAAYKVAMAHAQKFPVISVAGLSKRGGLSMTQAEALIKELATHGKVKLVGPSASGRVRAASKVYTKDAWGVVRTSEPRDIQRVQRRKEAQQHKAQKTKQQAQKVQQPKAEIAPWLAHLHDLCRAQGMALSPRCFA